MAGKVPTFKAPTFSFRETAVRMPDKIDMSGLDSIANELIRRGAEDNAEAAFQQGLSEQGKVTDGSLNQTEVNFFGRENSKSYNKGARIAFGIQKEQEIETTMFDLFNQHDHDLESFKSQVDDPAFRDRLLANTDIKDLGTFQSKLNQVRNRYTLKIQANEQRQSEAEQLFAFTEEAKRNRTSMSLAAETSGEVSPEVLAKQNAFYSSLIESGVSPTTVASWKAADELAVRQAQVVHGYDQAEDKKAYLDSLLTDNGPLKDVTVAERNSIRTVLNSRIADQKASATAYTKTLRSRIKDAIALEGKGKKSRDAMTLLETARHHPDLQEEIIDLSTAISNRQQIEAMTKQPTRNVQEALNILRSEVDKRGGHTNLTSGLEDGLLEILDENQKAYEQGNMLALAQERGLIQIEQATPDGRLADPEARQAQVEVARGYYGEVPFYTADEVSNFTDSYSQGDVQSRLELIGNLANTTPSEELPGILRQVAEKNPEMSYLVSSMASTNPRIQKQAREIMEGQEFAKTNGESIKKQSEVRARIQQELAMYLPADHSGRTMEALTESAFGLYVKRRINEGKLGGDGDIRGFSKDAARSVLGISDVVRINDAEVIPFEPFMKPQAMKRIWNSVTEQDLMNMNDGTMPVDNMGDKKVDVSFEKIKEEGTLVYRSPGVYMIAMPEAERTYGDPDGVISPYVKSERKFYLVNPQTKKPYLFKYQENRKEFRKRIQ